MPVEFNWRTQNDISDKVQLWRKHFAWKKCSILKLHAAFFYGKIRRRDVVEIDNELRLQTESIIASVREIVSKRFCLLGICC